jgi:protein gp37
MAKDSRIEWTHHTFNPWWGCVRVSPACKYCYADTWARRVGHKVFGNGAPRRFLSEAYWKQPLAWHREAAQAGRRERVFCASMADVFEDRDELNPWRARLWDLIDRTPNLDWLLLTKRPQHVGDMVPWGQKWPFNVWLGTTVETQRWAEERLPVLLQYPATVRFLSCEPLLGPLDLRPWLKPDENGRAVDWIIAGGESGPHARPPNPDWLRSLRDQGAAHGTAFHFKQWGNWRPDEGDATRRQTWRQTRQLRDAAGTPVTMVNMGKKEAGRNLDGAQWDGLPSPISEGR